MDFLNNDILDYAQKFSSKPSKLLQELERETQYKILMPRMLSGHLIGSMLKFLSYHQQPKHILEIGTYTGYSAICLAQGLEKNGHLHTIEINEELKDFACEYFHKAKLNKKITLHIGHALEIIPKIDVLFDLVFIDADKKNYCKYYDLVVPKLNKGGLLLIDNVLWSGKVLTKAKNNDIETTEIQKLNQKILNDKRVENILLPIRDGLMICNIL